MSALDDATGNVVSGALHKIGEGFEWLGTHTRRFMRDDLGFSQRVAQNTGDTVQIATEIFGPGAAAKGIGAMGRVSKSALKARFGENLSSAYSANRTQLNWNVVKHSKGTESVFEHIMTEHKKGINPRKDIQSIFYENPKQIIEAAWAKKNRLNIEAVNFPGSTADYYIVPWENVGYMNFGTYSEFKGGLLPKIECDHVIIMAQKGTSNIINGFPSSRTVNRDIFGRNILKGKRK